MDSPTLPSTPYFDRIAKFVYWINNFRLNSTTSYNDLIAFNTEQKAKRNIDVDYFCWDDWSQVSTTGHVC